MSLPTIDEGVEGGHGALGDTSVRVDLLEHYTIQVSKTRQQNRTAMKRRRTLEDVGRVSLLSGLGALLLVARARGSSLLAGLLLLSGSFASRGLAAGRGLLLSSFRCHYEVEE